MATTHFHDSFTGAADTLLDVHAPDVAPSGFAYGPRSPNDSLELNGAGSARHSSTTFGTNGSAGDGGAAWSLDLSAGFVMAMVATMTAEDGPNGYASFAVLSATREIQVRVRQANAGDTVIVQGEDAAGSFFYEDAIPALAVGTAVTVRLELSATSAWSVFVDDALIRSSSAESGLAMASANNLTVVLTVLNAGFGSTFSIQDVSIAGLDGPSPLLGAGDRPVTITLPAGTPAFLREGHAIEPVSAFAQVPMRTGHSRQRRIYTTAPRIVAVQLQLNQAQMTALDEWYETTLKAGERRFAALVQNQGPGLRWWEAQWLEPYTEEQPTSAVWRVRGQLLLTGEGSETAPDTSALAVEINAALTGSAALTVGAAIAAEIVAALVRSTRLAAEFVAALLHVAAPDNLRLEAGEFLLAESGDTLVSEAGRSLFLEAAGDLLQENGDDLLLDTGNELLLESGDSLLMQGGEYLLLE